jgi:hypothetical protein
MEVVKLGFVSILIIVGGSCFAGEVPFDEVISNPDRYNHQRITVKGLIETGGDDHDLWRDVTAMKHRDLKHWIHVWPDLRLPSYPGTNMSPDSPVNLHWVKVTGIFDTSIRGRFGNEPFGLAEEKIEILPGPRLKQYLAVLAWFKNESGHEVKINVKTKDWEEETTLDRKELFSAALEGSKCSATITNPDGSVYAKAVLTPPGSEAHYDAGKKYYYFLIRKNRIEPVPTAGGRHWTTAMPDRD